MNIHLGLSVPAFSDAVLLGNDAGSRPPPSRALDLRLPETEEGGGTLHVDGNGVIYGCSSGAALLLGRESDELVGDVIWHLVPALEGRRLVGESRVDPHLAFLCHCGVSFRVVHPGGTSLSCRMFVHSVSHQGSPALRLILRDDHHRPNICL